MAAPAGRVDASGGFDPGCGWQLHPQVSVRPEPFGALLYHFGTRKLSFLKNRTMVALVQSLADQPDARAACRAAGVDAAQESAYFSALAVLTDSNMLVRKESEQPTESKRQP